MAAATSLTPPLPQSTTPIRPPTTAHEIRSVAVKAHRDPRTVRAAYKGTATDIAVAAVTDAANELGFAPPPPRTR